MSDQSKFPYEVPVGFSVYKRAGATRRSRWEVAFSIGARRIVKRWSRSAEETLRRIQHIAPLGQIDPRAARYLLQEDKPLSRHLADHRRALLDKGNTAKHAGQVHYRASRIFAAFGCDRLSAIVPSQTLSKIASLTDARPTKRKRGRGGEGEKGGTSADVPPPAPRAVSLQTRNHFLRACKQFTAWLKEDKRLAEDPLEHLEGWNVRTDRRHDRQDLGEVGLDYLVRAARGGATVCQMKGADRAELYRTAALSGLRPNELRTLTPRRCELDAEHPVLVVPAAYSKHRREDRQPIPPWFAAELKKYIAGKTAGVDEPVWRVPAEAVDLILPDLEKARQMWIADAANARERQQREESDFLLYQDFSGRYADFYCLRHTYICGLVRLGVNPKECQLLARHANVSTTLDYYAHLRIADVARAASTIPNPSQPAAPERAKATGTYDEPQNSAQRNQQRAGVFSRPLMSTEPTQAAGSEESTMSDNPIKDNDKRDSEPSHLEGLEPSTFGSVDRRPKNVSDDLLDVTGAAKKRRSAIHSAPPGEEPTQPSEQQVLEGAMQKISRLVMSQRTAG